LNLDPLGETDYPALNIFVAYFILAFRNSIGDLATPEYNYWIAMAEQGDTEAQSMIYTIWFFWLLNIITFTILLLNFLIAVIS